MKTSTLNRMLDNGSVHLGDGSIIVNEGGVISHWDCLDNVRFLSVKEAKKMIRASAKGKSSEEKRAAIFAMYSQAYA